MMTREDIRELAAFQADSDGCALSFYFQPHTPQNKSHKEEAILAKDLVRQALRESEKQGKNGGARADLDRILDMAGNLRGNQARANGIVRPAPAQPDHRHVPQRAHQPDAAAERDGIQCYRVYGN